MGAALAKEGSLFYVFSDREIYQVIREGHNRLVVLSVLSLLSILLFTACGTLEVGFETPVAPADAAASTAEAVAAEDAALIPAPMTPTPVPDGYGAPTPEPAFTPVPIDAYAVPDGLRVVFAQDDGIWLWTAETRAAALLTSVGDDLFHVKLSGDGLVVAFRRADELWAINSDGTNERQLLRIEDFETMESDGVEARLNRFEWVPGTHTLAFNTRLRLEARDLLAEDLHQVDADTLERAMLLPPGEGGEFTYSPDGGQIAVVTPGDVSLLDADGADRRESVLTYAPVAMYSEDDFYVKPVWASDGSDLMVAVPPPDPDARPLQHTTIWRIPTDGASAELVFTINALPVEDAVSFSPLLTYVAYGEVLQLGDTPAEVQIQLKVVRLTNGDWQAYADPSALYGWAPGSRRFAFVAGRERPQLRIGQWSGATLPGSVDAGVPVQDFCWVDRDHYLFVARYNGEQGAERDRLDLILGDIGGSSTVLVSAADVLTYDFARASIAPSTALCPDGGVPAVEAPAMVDVSNWQVYEGEEHGFQFRYPERWRVEVFDSWVGVGPEEMGEDVQWGVRFFDSSDTTVEQVISDVGRQFGSGRTEARECVYVGDIAAIKLIVTASQIEDWHAESVVFEHQGTVFEITNGAVDDGRFQAFYDSFRLNR
jgi:hypothetical protein